MTQKIDNLIDSLQKIQYFSYSDNAAARYIHARADDVLSLIFEIAQLNYNYSRRKRLILGNLIGNAIIPLKATIERSACLYRTTLDPAILIKRSAVQFLIDDFGEFPCNGREDKLIDELKRNNIDESVSILDEIIRDFADASDSDEGSKVDVTHTPNVPASHTWWHK